MRAVIWWNVNKLTRSIAGTWLSVCSLTVCRYMQHEIILVSLPRVCRPINNDQFFKSMQLIESSARYKSQLMHQEHTYFMYFRINIFPFDRAHRVQIV